MAEIAASVSSIVDRKGFVTAFDVLDMFYGLR